MRRSHSLLTALLLHAAVAPLAAGQVTPADSAALFATTQRLMDAITFGDTAIWAANLSPRWFLTDEEGRHLTRSEFLRELHGLPSGQNGQLRVLNGQLLAAPNVAVLTYDTDEWHNFYGQELRTRFHQTDTWVHEKGGWKMLASQITALPTPIAGRAVPARLLEDYAGSYDLTKEISLRIVASDSGLSLVRGASPPERLYAIDDRIFIRHGVRGFWIFERDEKGAVYRLVNWRDNNAVRWRRHRSP